MSQKKLQYYKDLEYNIIIKQEELDGEKWYVAYCNELGLNACHGIGEDKVSALNSFIEEKDAFIEMLYNKGDVIPDVSDEEQNFSGIFSVRTSSWIHSTLVLQAKLNGVSLNSFVNQLLSYGAGQRDTSLKCERRIKDLEVIMASQNDAILRNLKSIDYKTTSLFSKSTISAFTDCQYKSAV